MGYKVEQVPAMVPESGAIVTMYNVIETNQFSETATVFSTDDEKGARKMSRQLNFGSGFDGWTPNFINYKY